MSIIASLLQEFSQYDKKEPTTQWRLPYDMETPEGQSIAVEMVKEIPPNRENRAYRG